MQKEEQVSFLAEKIRQADAVLIGGGSGLSSAAGYNHYHWLPYMEECLQDFKEWYGLKSPFDGFYYCYSSPEQQWAYYARYAAPVTVDKSYCYAKVFGKLSSKEEADCTPCP